MTNGPSAILAITSDETVSRALDKCLSSNGYVCVLARSPDEGIVRFRQAPPALVLVDRRQRSMTGLLQAAAKDCIPVVSLQPPDQPCDDEDCVEDLQSGVDQVICTDSYREVVARIRALLRRARASSTRSQRFEICGLCLDVERHEVSVNGRAVELTPKEFQILSQLMQNPARVFTRQELLNRVWGEDWALEEHTLDVHIYSLRQKIETDAANPAYVLTVRGVGYKLQSDRIS
ncbi:MAG TPA: response regulator transcription factor [Nitrospiraceae bacterium]|nr:response regulator transcription factor [Nitrospiraceae bacterium]